MYENNLKGTIPSELGKLPLEELYLFSNFLGGAIPAELFDADSMLELRLDNNFLQGPLPTEVGKMTDLEDLRLHNNNVGRTPP